MAITLNNKPTMYEFYWMLKGKLQCILTISHLASLFQNLKHANHLALHFAPLCVLSGQNLLLSYVESPVVILSYSPFAKQNQTEDWQIFKSFCIEIKVLKESKYKMPLVHCAFAMFLFGSLVSLGTLLFWSVVHWTSRWKRVFHHCWVALLGASAFSGTILN